MDAGDSDFDAVIDFDRVLRDPDHPARLPPAYDSGDHLHPNDAGSRRRRRRDPAFHSGRPLTPVPDTASLPPATSFWNLGFLRSGSKLGSILSQPRER